jgi:hypothetical protein
MSGATSGHLRDEDLAYAEQLIILERLHADPLEITNGELAVRQRQHPSSTR